MPAQEAIGFYFDVGGVLIPDPLGQNAREIFRQFGERFGSVDPQRAYDAYTRLQPQLDLGTARLADLCRAAGFDQAVFEREWLALHPVDQEVLAVIDELVARRRPVGLATNFCRGLLELVLTSAPVLSRLSICCSADIGVVKPSAEFFSRASEIIHARETVFVDDRAANIAAAQKFGWTTVYAEGDWLGRFKDRYLGA